jgi:hypothetical protein
LAGRGHRDGWILIQQWWCVVAGGGRRSKRSRGTVDYNELAKKLKAEEEEAAKMNNS